MKRIPVMRKVRMIDIKAFLTPEREYILGDPGEWDISFPIISYKT
jgi:hypothetical protein